LRFPINIFQAYDVQVVIVGFSSDIGAALGDTKEECRLAASLWGYCLK